ncbi:hypothetical protein GGR50DRAFT_645245 [Xylaria sp. CBS 124048]|nr:hypothetical protein GGR50DRAFT_645245 [Xylaria sp. CBS 124048]
MVDKGLIVTLVLDCCYSGNVARHDGIDFAIRGIEYNPNIPIVESEILENSISSSSRLARVVNDWLVDPAGYTILSACGPYELAYEVNITGQGRFGSLTYYLLRTLRALKTKGESITHQSLHDRLRAEFRESWPRQTPMRYGNKHLSFFGTLIDAHEPASVSVYRTKDRICIAAGQVHGINEGDEFALLPFGESQQVAEQRRRVMKVRTVRPFESELDAIRPESEPTTEIMTGWRAKLITASHARKVRVKLEAAIDNKHLWKDASQKLPYSHVGTEEEGEDYIFNVVINKKGEYAVLDALHQGDLGLPTVPVNAPDAMAKVLRIVDHITTYKYLEGVNNPFPEKSFQALFSVTSPSTVDSSGVYAVSHGDTWRFTVKNTRRKPLFMTVYNFTSEWAVTNLISETGGDSYCVIPPPRNSETEYVEEIPLDMEVPEGTRGGLCKDILKVFITSKPVSFPTQILPDMPRYVDDLDHDVNGMDFFKESETHDRGVENDDDGIGDEWVTHNFVIQTTLKSYR